jgi:hypothetical protein
MGEKLRQSAMTKPKFYVDQEERILSGNGINGVDKHHVMFPKDVWQKGDKLHRDIAKLGGFVHLMSFNVHHFELHSAIETPTLTSVHLMEDIIRVQNGYQNLAPITRLSLTIGRLGELAISPDPLIEREALGLIDNFGRQRTFIELGKVTLLEDM